MIARVAHEFETGVNSMRSGVVTPTPSPHEKSQMRTLRANCPL